MYYKIRKSNKLTEELNLYDKQNITSEKQSQQQVFDIVNKLSLSHRRVFNVIILLSNKYKCIYIRQDTIGKYIKLCRQRINEILQDLKSLFLIDMWYRHMKSCVYSINTLFNNFTLRRKLCQLLPALGLFCIAWLYAPNHDATQLVLDNNNYLSLFTDTKRRDAEILEQREIKRKEELKKERLRVNIHTLFPEAEIAVANKPQKREIVSNESTKKLFPKALVVKAKKIWELAQQDRMNLSRARRELAEWKTIYPESIPAFREWYNTPDGVSFREWIEQ